VHKATHRFWSCFALLPVSIRILAKKNYILLKHNPKHPSLHFKKTGKLWSVRIGKNYRALALKDNDHYIWLWVGNHNEYEKLLNK